MGICEDATGNGGQKNVGVGKYIKLWAYGKMLSGMEVKFHWMVKKEKVWTYDNVIESGCYTVIGPIRIPYR